MTINILVFGTQNFNNSLDEIKEDLGFSFTYFNQKKTKDPIDESISGVVVDSQICEDQNILLIINKIFNKPILLLESQSFTSLCRYDDKNLLPINFSELESKIKNSIIAFKFNKNSSVEIKNFILDKNEKKLKKRNKFIVITEREVQLIELLFNEKKPLSKNSILKKLWKYADDADTHTVETHIYRLRKKIVDKFKDGNFIINSKSGYSL
jgi:hypothetical protein|tara:strand:- start:474 stop:1103 length:630 start_codon:yes stop_codon:yes gene_type:complete